jgi:hypothetical protein
MSCTPGRRRSASTRIVRRPLWAKGDREVRGGHGLALARGGARDGDRPERLVDAGELDVRADRPEGLRRGRSGVEERRHPVERLAVGWAGHPQDRSEVGQAGHGLDVLGGLHPVVEVFEEVHDADREEHPEDPARIVFRRTFGLDASSGATAGSMTETRFAATVLAFWRSAA